MSSYCYETRICAVCGKESKQKEVASTNSFGSPDQDLRPAPMKRDTMHAWLEVCPHCGYASVDISKDTSATLQRLQQEDYVTCAGHEFRSSLAKAFYRAWMLAPACGSEEVYLLRCASWACDDCGDKENADHCRRLAAEKMLPMIEADDNESLIVLRADMLRRSGAFAEVIADYGETLLQDDMLKQLLAFELKKAGAEDSACYTVEDAMKG